MGFETKRKSKRFTKPSAVLLALGTFAGWGMAGAPVAQAAPTAPPVASDGTVQISTAAQLEYVDQNQISYINANIVLMNDIDFTDGYNWIPFSGNYEYGGTFNGQGYEIAGLTIDDTTDANVGFFGETRGTIENVGIDAAVTATNSASVGGLVGDEDGGSISDCYATGSVNGGDSTYTGGLVGYLNSSISNSYATSSVSSTGMMTGGLVGYQYGSVSDCYATGSVSGGNPAVSYTGGLAGIQGSASISYSYFDEDTTDQINGVGAGPASGVIGESDADMQLESTYSGWDFTHTWGISAGVNNGYPHLLTAAAAPDLNNAGIGVGSTGGTTEVTATVASGDSLEYALSSTALGTTPHVGDMAPANGTAYTSGSDISATTGQYLDVYEVDGSGDDVAFDEFPLTSSDISPATETSADVNDDTLTMTFSGDLQGSQADPDAFTVMDGSSQDAVTNATVSGASVTLTLQNAVEFGDAATVEYSPTGQNDLTDTNGNAIAAFTDESVTNNSPAPTAVILANGSLGAAGDSEITGLTSGQEYQVTVGAGSNETTEYVTANGTLSANASDAALLTGTSITGLTNGTIYDVQGYLLAPTGLAFSNTTSTSTTLSWMAVPGATSYNVYENGSQVATDVTGTSYTVNNLTPGASYSFTVSAVNASGASTQSALAINIMTGIGSVQVAPTSIDVLSGASVPVTGVVYDWFDAPVPYAIVNFSTPSGSWGATNATSGSTTADANGSFSTTWQAPTVSTETSVSVTASVYGTVYGAVSDVTPTILSWNVAPPPSIVTTTLPGATDDGDYSATLNAAGGFAPDTWRVSQGTLPSGLTLDASTGVISGTPTQTGTSRFTVMVKDKDGNKATQDLSIAVAGAPSSGGGPVPPFIDTISFVADAQVGTPYAKQILAVGGAQPYNWRVASGTLPQGLTLSDGGLISGTPTGASGKYAFTVSVSDGNHLTATRQLTLTVDSAHTPSITTTRVGVGTVGQSYDAGLSATGGTSPYKWSVANGTLPDGVTLNAQTGELTGTPTKSGVDTVTIEVTDANGQTTTQALSLDVLQPNQRAIVWNGKAQNVPAIVGNDSGTQTTYVPIWYVMQWLKSMGIESAWNGHEWRMTSTSQVDLTNVQAGSGNTSIYVNGTLVQDVNTRAAVDPSTDKPTTYMPIWYVEQVLNRVGLTSTWDGTTWTVTQQNS